MRQLDFIKQLQNWNYMTDSIKSLTKGGIRRLMEMEEPDTNTEEIVLQVTQIKLFEEKKKKNSIKQR